MSDSSNFASHSPTWQGKPFSVESYTTGPVFVADTQASRANKAVFEWHLVSEWKGDIENTMGTIHRDNPYQKIPALGVDCNGFDEIRAFYLGRFESWPGPALQSFDRVTITDRIIYVEGKFDVTSTGNELAGLNVAGKSVSTSCMIVLECKDGLLLGERVYMDKAASS